MYCKYAEYGCKLQTNLFMNSKQCHDMQKKCNIAYFEYVEYAGICKNHSHVQPKNGSIKMTEYAEKCNIVIRRSKNTSFTHI